MRNQVKLAVCVLAVGLISTVLYAVDGTSGDNNWTGTTGDDLYNGLGGNDFIKGLAGNDTLNGDGGNDIIVGDEGEDTLNGGSGNDTITAGVGGVSYARTATQLQSYGGHGGDLSEWKVRYNHTYTMVEGLQSPGTDSYITTSSDDNYGWASSDRLKLKGFDFSAIPDDAIISGIEILIIKQNPWHNQYVYDQEIRVEKANGTLGINQAKELPNVTMRYGGPDSMMGLSLTPAEVKHPNFGFVLRMKVNDDYGPRVDHAKLTIYTSGTNADTATNHITGGTGNDLLYGSDQSDNYYYSSGDGLDSIYEVDAVTSVDDKVVFAEGILPDDIWFKRSDGPADLYVTLQRVPIILIKGWYTGNASYFGVDKFEFHDGTIWNRADFYDLTMNLPQWGTSGNDTWVGNELANEYDGRAGNDNITGNGGDDKLFGGAGSDTVNGNAGLDYIYGGSEITTDTLDGGEDDDIIQGGRGADVLKGGPGNDQLYGRNGPGIYDRHPRSFTAEANDDWVGNPNGLNVFGSHAMSTSKRGEDVGEYSEKTIFFSNFDFSAIPDSAFIRGFEINLHKYGGLMIDRTVRLRKADGTYGRNVAKATNASYVSYDDGGDLMGLYITAAELKHPNFGLELTLDVEGWDDRYLHYVDVTVITSETSVTGRNYDITGDQFTGGPGDDECHGTGGNDTYYYNLSDGHDAFYEVNASGSSNDRLILGENILPDDISFSRTSDPLDLVIYHQGAPIITVKGWYTNTSGDFGIDRIEFDGGTIWNRADFYDLTWNLPAVGSNGDDRWIGTNVHDEYDGLAGDDFIYGGVDRTADTISGGADNDIVHGGLGADVLNGGPGHDHLFGRNGFGVYDSQPLTYTPEANDNWEGHARNLNKYGSYALSTEHPHEDVGEYSKKTILFKKFDFSAISDSATITGFEINLHKHGPLMLDYSVRLKKADGTYGVNVGTNGSDYYISYGGGDDMMGLSITPAELKNANFGLELILDVEGWDYRYLHYVDVTVFTTDLTGRGRNYDTTGDQFTGGPGNDSSYGTQGNDVYHYSSGDGDDAIYETIGSHSDRLIFASDISPADITFETPVNSTADLILKIAATPAGSVTLKNWFSSVNGHQSIDIVEFTDGSGITWNLPDLQSKAATATVNKQSLVGGAPIFGTQNSDHLIGTASDDILGGNHTDIYGINNEANSPGNTYDAGAGNDTVNGTTFGDTYLFNLGDGSDTIVEAFNTNSATAYTDKLVFGSGLLASNLSVTRNGNDLLLSFSTGESVTIQNWFLSAGHQVEEIEFADSTVWAPTDVNNQLPGGTDTSLTWNDAAIGQGSAASGRLSSGNPVTGEVYSTPGVLIGPAP